jgi:ABC-type lipoprotein release transport system permease subunit
MADGAENAAVTPAAAGQTQGQMIAILASILISAGAAILVLIGVVHGGFREETKAVREEGPRAETRVMDQIKRTETNLINRLDKIDQQILIDQCPLGLALLEEHARG